MIDRIGFLFDVQDYRAFRFSLGKPPDDDLQICAFLTLQLYAVCNVALFPRKPVNAL